MTARYQVRLDKDQFVFSCAHFITFNGNICERLHGHNYRVWAEVEGALDENQYVIDFIALRDELKRLCDAWDHHVLLPTEHPTIHVVADEREVTATFEQRRWIFPVEDCILLPVANTTAELLARHLGELLLDALGSRLNLRPETLRVAVDENHGQWAICELHGA